MMDAEIKAVLIIDKKVAEKDIKEIVAKINREFGKVGFKGGKESATIGSWTAGERNDILESSCEYDGVMDIKRISPFKFRENLVCKTIRRWSLKDAINMETLRALPPETFDILANASMEINRVSIQQAKNSGAP